MARQQKRQIECSLIPMTEKAEHAARAQTVSDRISLCLFLFPLFSFFNIHSHLSCVQCLDLILLNTQSGTLSKQSSCPLPALLSFTSYVVKQWKKSSLNLNGEFEIVPAAVVSLGPLFSSSVWTKCSPQRPKSGTANFNEKILYVLRLQPTGVYVCLVCIFTHIN